MCEGHDEDYLASSREITAGRILLESPYGWQWYLGDRVTRQSMRSAFPQVPGPLPPRVLRTSSYTLEEIHSAGWAHGSVSASGDGLRCLLRAILCRSPGSGSGESAADDF